ncbi:allophanate hydrolase [Rhodococcus sp. 06-462-5]|uniref:5-oxoprolinase subunit C family protein n=1 Tax=unclassified Rhodococcus (in: high G+C Gram-positive bacteria) TaxID=192944 RepID=UPI000B9BAC93|nr:MULTISPECIES: biotin-dependent carboxyltransferase family protein [unclassified Rhodococcus (in: high G+C Gram-positive bacteria)]OZC77230.1 allophanate hydrolase [Rhodococcus sp. 06-462-5]OZE63387.1 allophanate hydrolase [Rhodococcus sp. 02-925g]
MTERPGLLVTATGPLSTFQDLGRVGWFASGVGVSGAADRGSHALANRLVGNLDSAASIECLLGGLELRAGGAVTLAVTGAAAPITVDQTAVGHSTVIHLDAGQTLRIGMAEAGLRVYIAIRGGFDIDPVLGSRSRDTLSGIGPEPLSAGMYLGAGADRGRSASIDVAPVRAMTTAPVVARVVLGPRDDWFAEPHDLFVGWWEISDRTDRIGARLIRHTDFPPLTRFNDKELPTEGMPLGAIQVPPSGEPVVFLADHPITGGYPVIGTVVDDDLDSLAQARPGQCVIFRAAPGARAHHHRPHEDKRTP